MQTVYIFPSFYTPQHRNTAAHTVPNIVHHAGETIGIPNIVRLMKWRLQIHVLHDHECPHPY